MNRLDRINKTKNIEVSLYLVHPVYPVKIPFVFLVSLCLKKRQNLARFAS
jgi:hypothetical protein